MRRFISDFKQAPHHAYLVRHFDLPRYTPAQKSCRHPLLNQTNPVDLFASSAKRGTALRCGTAAVCRARDSLLPVAVVTIWYQKLRLQAPNENLTLTLPRLAGAHHPLVKELIDQKASGKAIPPRWTLVESWSIAGWSPLIRPRFSLSASCRHHGL